MRAINKRSVVVALAGLLLAAAAFAAAPEQGWRLRVNGYWLDTDEGRVSPLNTGYRSRVENASSAGGGITGEYRFGPRLGLELGLLGGADTDYTVTFDSGMMAANDTLSFDAACVGLNVHLTPGRKVDVYAGPLLAYVTYSHLSFRVAGVPPESLVLLAPVSVNLGDEIALGASLGADVQITQNHWLFNVGLKYLVARPDSTLEGLSAVPYRDTATIDPLMIGMGFGYRF